MAKPSIFNRVVTEVKAFRNWRIKSLADFSFDTQNLGSFVAWLKKANKMTERQYMEAYEEVGYVNMCVRAIAEAVAKLELEVTVKLKNGKEKEIEQHPILDLLANPGNQQTAFSLMELTQTYLELTGASYWFIERGTTTGLPKSILTLRPDRMQIVINPEDETIKGFIHHSENGTEVPLDLEEIVYIHMPNPLKPWKGIGTIQAAQAYIDTEKYTTDWSKQYMYNNGSPSGIVNIKSNVNESEFKQIKRKWADEYGGVDNAGKVAFLKNMDASFVPIGASMKDIALTELKGQSLSDIMATFRVSKPILGIFDDVNLASAKTAFYVFHKVVVDPKMHRIVDALQAQLLPLFNDTVKYCLDYVSPVVEDQDERVAYYNAGYGKWLSTNDIREAENMPKINGGDSIMVPMNLIPLEATTADSTTSQTLGSVPTPNDIVEPVDGEQVMPSDAEGGGDTPMDMNGSESKKLTITVSRKKKIAQFKLSGKQKEKFRLNLYRTAGKYSDKIEKSLAKEFNRMRKDALKHIDTHFKDLTDYGIDPTEEALAISDSITPLLVDLMAEQGGYAMSFVGQGEDFKINQTINRYVEHRVTLFTDPLLQELSDSISSAITAGMLQGMGSDGIGALVNNVFDNYESVRANLIARTESSAASNAATRDAYKQSEFVTGMEWYANPGACPSCEELDGKIVSLDNNFADLGTTIGAIKVDYVDIGNPPLHPNCECTILPALIS